jgi:hypothetical protein
LILLLQPQVKEKNLQADSLLKTLQLLNYLKYPQPHQQFSKENKGL